MGLSRRQFTKEFELMLQALRRAPVRRRPAPRLVHHSDRGVQYASHDCAQPLQAHGIQVSMSRKGRQERYNDRFGVSAGRFGPFCPSPQRVSISLRAGGLRRDAGKRRKGSHIDARPDLLRRSQRCSCRWPERAYHQTCEIPRILGKGQRRSVADTGRVNQQLREVPFSKGPNKEKNYLSAITVKESKTPGETVFVESRALEVS